MWRWGGFNLGCFWFCNHYFPVGSRKGGRCNNGGFGNGVVFVLGEMRLDEGVKRFRSGISN